MRKMLFSFVVSIFAINLFSQNVTIEGTIAAGTAAPLFTIKNTTTQANAVYAEFPFMMGSRYTGAIKSIAYGASSAKLSLFTYSNATYSNLRERFTIFDDGKILVKDDANYASTDVPNTAFDIIGGASGVITQLLTLRSDFTADNTGTGLSLINSTSSSSAVGSQIISQTITSANGKSDLIFKSHGGGGVYGGLLERMRITGYGSILITSNNNDANITLSGSTIGTGNAFSILSSNALTGGTNLNGGNLILSGGSSTGNGYSKISFKVAKSGTSGTTTNTPIEVFAIGGSSNDISITDASFNLSHSSPTPNDGMSSQVNGASVAAFALWGRNSCPSTAGTGYGNANSNIAVSGQMESDKEYSFGLHAMVTPCTSTLPNNSAGVYGTYTNSSSIMQASGALGYRDGSGNFFGAYGQSTGTRADTYYGLGAYDDILFPSTSYDFYMTPLNDMYGYIGTATKAYYRVYSYGGSISLSSGEKKRNITYLDENKTLEEYVINDIKKIRPTFYKYKLETDIMEKGNETKFRPNLYLGLILEETPDYLQDNQFSGIDIYSLSTFALTGAKYSIEKIEKLENEIEYLKKIILLLCKKNDIEFTMIQNNKKNCNLTPPINGLKIDEQTKLMIKNYFLNEKEYNKETREKIELKK